LGSPEDFAKKYYEDGADELFYQDVVASLYERNSLHDFITRTAKEIFIPLTVGGGIRTIEDIKKVLRAGADKVSINTAAINNPQFIKQAARVFGSSTIVVAIEAIRQPDGSYLAYTDNGREYTGIEVISWAKQVEQFGAGEICLTSIDKEGLGEGFDIELIKSVAEAVDIPIIAHGGAGNSQDVIEAIKAGSSAVSIASILHYEYLNKNRDIEKLEKREEGNLEFLKNGVRSAKIKPLDLSQIKNELIGNSINCRY